MKRLKKLQESLPTEDFTPRDYQLDLLENARHENTIAALGSDGGKSFLALSLLREMAQEMRRGAERKVAFVTVETDAAAEDYVRAVHDHTDFSAATLKDASLAEPLAECDVIISSHDNFILLMSDGEFEARNISVLVIDECTAAVAKYPYKELFLKYFSGFVVQNGGTVSKPRVLALTSSLLTSEVVSDPSVLESVINRLEEAFWSSLRTSVGLVSVDRFGYAKDVKLLPYSTAFPDSQKEYISAIRHMLADLQVFTDVCHQVSEMTDVEKSETMSKSSATSIFKVAISETLDCLRILGLWPTYRLINIICRDLRQALVKNLLEQRIMRLLLAVLSRFQQVGVFLEKSFGFSIMEKGSEKILEFVSDKLRIIVRLMDPYNPRNPDEGKVYIPVQYLSMIINVEKPYLAWAVNRFLRDLKAPDKKGRYGYVTSSYCLGSFNSDSTAPVDACFFGMPFKVQEEILRRFRNRDFNVLVSTCTNDVTLDVPQCTFMIQFDPVNDYLTYIHAKQRTKSKYGTLCIMVPDVDLNSYIQSCFTKFTKIDSMVLAKCPDYIVRNGEVTESFDISPDPLRAALTGAEITMKQAIGVVNRYCSNLPSDAFANLTPLTDIVSFPTDPATYQCHLTLPINAPIKYAVVGMVAPSRRLAKQAAALSVCKQLYALGELDESLMPVSKETWKAEIARDIALEPQEITPDDGPKPGTTKRRQYYAKKVPAVLTSSLPVVGAPCYLFAIELKLTCPVPSEQNIRGRQIRYPDKATRIFGILSADKIPSVPDFNIYDRSGEIRVSLKLVCDNVAVGHKELDMAQHFHYVIFSHVLALERYSLRYSPASAPSRFLVVPVCRENQTYKVDWSYMDVVLRSAENLQVKPVDNENRAPFDMEKYSDAVVMPWYRSIDQPQSFYVEQICPWLTVESEFPDGDFHTFDKYYSSKYHISVQYKDQPLLDVDHTSSRLNLLLPRFLSRKGSSLVQTEKKEMLRDKEPRHRQILVPELCQVHPIPASLWRQGICLPTILHRMETLLVMDELLTNIKALTGISSKCPTHVSCRWPMLDYGWSFEEKIKNLEGSHLERDATDQRNASIIEKARLRYETATKFQMMGGQYRTVDVDELSEVSSVKSGFSIGMWNPEPFSVPKSLVVGSWSDSMNDMEEQLDPELEPAVPFFEHVKMAFGKKFEDASSPKRNGGLGLREITEEKGEGFGVEVDWGCDADDGNVPGISVVSGFPDDLRMAIEKDLTNLNLDDSGNLRGGSEMGDTETIADSIMTSLPCYNLEALDPLKDREEEDIGPVISSILHLRFSESAPDDLRTRVQTLRNPFADVFEEMSEFDAGGEPTSNDSQKRKSYRAEFGEVVRSSVEDLNALEVHKSRPLVLVEPAVKFDDDRDPTTVLGPNPGILLQAFTSSNANDGINLERLETVGDSFLKFSMTTYLYFRYSSYHEGKLSFMRSLQVSNYNLYRLGFKKHFGEILLSSKFEPCENWLPPCYILDDHVDDVTTPNLRTQHCISDKTLADCVESLVGAYLISSGIKAAQLLMSWLGLHVLPERPGSENAETMVERYTWFPSPGTVLLESGPGAMKELDRLLDGYAKFEEQIGYRFNDRAYLLQAFTHASYTYNRVTDCYQRLEFLGDAVLDYLITRHLFEDLRNHTPGALTDLRSALVNNAIFASLAVRYEYHKYVKLMSPAIFHLVEKYVKEQRERDQNVTLFTEDIFFYDPAVEEDLLEDEGGAEETECPKVLGDVFESVAGAIYLDSGMSLDAVWRVYYSMMKPEIEQCSSNIPKSPVRELLELEPENVRFSVPERTASGKIRVAVEIFDKGKFVGLGRNYRTAKCTAAKQALKYLRSLDENRNFSR